MKFLPRSPCTGFLLLCTISAFGAEQTAKLPSISGQDEQTPRLQLLEKFDRNGDHQLDASEREAALAYIAAQAKPPSTPAPTRPGTIAPLTVALEPVKSGDKISPERIHAFPNQPLYDAATLRTLFLEFDTADWEKELTAFARTDVAVPAKLILDGKNYSGVGVQFHNQDATPVTGAGYKRALDLTLDYTTPGQTIGGKRQLKLLDGGTDPTLVRSVLYAHVARQYIPAPRANLVQVVINGENWGIYVSAEPIDESFIKENFKTTEGAWWSVSPGGTLSYLGDKAEAYRGSYHLQTHEDPAAWTALIDLCKILNQTPANQLERAIAKRLDIDSTLRFFALENVLINQDGYGGSTGGYGLYLAADGRFQLIPQDAEASLRLIEINEYEKRPQHSGPRHDDRKVDPTKNSTGDKSQGKTPEEVALQSYNPKNFPRETVTDLAMLLSYSFVNKSDSDFDSKVTREEWLTFARSWFLVMDEDLVGKLTRDQFLTKFRGLLTPASIADGRTKQTFGKDDAAGIIGQDFFKAMDRNQDGQLTSQEVTDTFAQWFSQWSDPKTAVITQPILQKAFNTLFSRTVFQAEQSYIARHDATIPTEEERGGRGRGGHGGGNGGGNGIGIGPLRIGGHGGKGGEGSTLVTFSEELDPLAGLDETGKPLLTKLLSVPVLRTRYLEYVQDLNDNWLTWSKLGPIAKPYHELIADEFARETHRATSYAHFVQEFDQDTTQGSRDGDAAASLKSFVTERHGYLAKDGNVMGTNNNP